MLDSTKQNKTDLKFSKAHAAEIGKENVKSVGRQFFKVSSISVYLVKKLCDFCFGRIFVYQTTLEDTECLLQRLRAELFPEQTNRNECLPLRAKVGQVC